MDRCKVMAAGAAAVPLAILGVVLGFRFMSARPGPQKPNAVAPLPSPIIQDQQPAKAAEPPPPSRLFRAININGKMVPFPFVPPALEPGDDPSIRQPLRLEWAAIGDLGARVEILQILNSRQMLVTGIGVGQKEKRMTVMLVGWLTVGLADGQTWRSDPGDRPAVVVATCQYETVTGGGRTVFVIIPFEYARDGLTPEEAPRFRIP